jgi:hypothetical protein
VVIDDVGPTCNARGAFGSAEPHAKIVRPLPAPAKEDNYGSAAGKAFGGWQGVKPSHEAKKGNRIGSR